MTRFPSARRMALLETMGVEIRARRIKAGMDVKALAERADIGEDTIKKIEAGMSMPSVFTFYLIAEALKCTMDDLTKTRIQ